MRQSGVVGTSERKTSEAIPMDSLRKIEKAGFPFRVDAFDDINNVLVLKRQALSRLNIREVPASRMSEPKSSWFFGSRQWGARPWSACASPPTGDH